MDTGQLLTILDLSGVWAFAVSGSLTAMQKRMDIFGVLIVAFGTSFAGGTIRDVLINRPVFWLHNETYLYILFISVPVAVLFRNYLQYLRKALFFFDTIGLALFTVVGVGKSLALGYPFWVAIIMGSITGAAGGVIRDVFINEIPLIFRKEIYAMACVVGGTTYWICELAGMQSYGCQVIGGISVFITLILAVKYKICLPILSGNDEEGQEKEG